MTTGDNFMETLKDWEKELEKIVKKPKPHVELTSKQKRIIVEYALCALDKGFFEDCEDFWENMSQEQIDESYPAYRDESEKFVNELKQHILDTLGV